MIMLSEIPMSDLLHDLMRQYPLGVTTFASCSQGCGGSARGGAACGECLQAELGRRGVPAKLINDLTTACRQMQLARLDYEAASEMIRSKYGTIRASKQKCVGRD